MLKDEPVKQDASRLNWLLWWRVDPIEISDQLADYNKFGPLHTVRGWSLLALSFSALITVLFIVLGGLPATGYVDCVVMIGLGVFIYFGHRWAIIGAMAFWTLEKILGLVGSPAGAVTSLLWWAAYMHIFFLALKVENARRASSVAKPD